MQDDMNPIRFDFFPKEQGWLSLTLDGMDKSLWEFSSLRDSVGELAAAILALVEGRAETCHVPLLHDPGVTVIELGLTEHGLRVVEHDLGLDAAMPTGCPADQIGSYLQGSEGLVIYHGPLTRFAADFHQAFQALEHRTQSIGYQSVWGHPAPAALETLLAAEA